MTGWRMAAIGWSIDEIKIGGLNVWKQEWRPVKADKVLLPNPAYPKQIHAYDIYEIGEPSCPVCFAASELSNGVWGFYVPDKNSSN